MQEIILYPGNGQESINGMKNGIYKFSKRQMTWLRGMERRGLTIHWINGKV